MNPDPAATLAIPERTIGAVLAGVCRRLEKMAVPSPRLCAEHLVARCLGVARLKLPLLAREPLGDEVVARIEAGSARLAGHEPLQYVLGDAEFMGFRFRADARALIPRPETECLVEEALKRLPSPRDGVSPLVVDVGTGTGCILISLALLRPDVRGVGIDCSAEALALAGENAEALGVSTRLDFLSGHLLGPMPPDRPADLIAANLPYVPTGDWRRLDRQVRCFEPRSALDGGEDGLAFIRELAASALLRLRSGGWLVLETGEDQTEECQRLLAEGGFVQVAGLPDLSGRPRIVIGCRP